MDVPTRILRGVSAFALVGLVAAAAPATAGTVYSWRTEDGSHAFTDDPERIPERYREQAESRAVGALEDYEQLTRADATASAAHAARLERRLDHLRALNGTPAASPRRAVRHQVARHPAARFVGKPLLRSHGVAMADEDAEDMDDMDGEGTETPAPPRAYDSSASVAEMGRFTGSASGAEVADPDIGFETTGPFGHEGPGDDGIEPSPVFGPVASGDDDGGGEIPGGPVRTSRVRSTDEFVPAVNFNIDPYDEAPVIVEKKRMRDRDTMSTRHITIVRQGDRVLGIIKPRAHVQPPYFGDEEDLEDY